MEGDSPMRSSNFALNGALIVGFNLAIYGGCLIYMVAQKPLLPSFENFKCYAYNYINAHVSATKVSLLESDPEIKIYTPSKQTIITLPNEAKEYLNIYYTKVSQASEQPWEKASPSIHDSIDLERLKCLKKTIKLAAYKGSLETRILILENLKQFYGKLEGLLSNKEAFAKAFSLKNKRFLTQEIYGGGVESSLVDYDLKDLLCEFRKEVYMRMLYGNFSTNSYLGIPIKAQHKALKKLHAFIDKLERA